MITLQVHITLGPASFGSVCKVIEVQREAHLLPGWERGCSVRIQHFLSTEVVQYSGIRKLMHRTHEKLLKHHVHMHVREIVVYHYVLDQQRDVHQNMEHERQQHRTN